MDPQYTEGQRVKIVALIDGFGRPDPRLQAYVHEKGTVVKSYYVSADEIWEKTLKLEDVYCYDIRLDSDSTVLPGIPEVALETDAFWRT